ncbi:MAG: hypothetical protein Q8K97_17930 [Pseudohongiella sp.]|nr:hypothetical protein [Pseudohongiella sp.]
MAGLQSSDNTQAIDRILESLTDLIAPSIQIDLSATDDVIHQKILAFLQKNY